MIYSQDVFNAYSYFGNHITQELSSIKKVKVVNIEGAIINSNTLRYKAYIIYFSALSAHRTATDPCDPISTNAKWSASLAGPCSGRGDAPSNCESRLNCSAYTCSNGGSLYYTNVTTINFNNVTNGYPSALFYMLCSTACDPALLSATQQNNFVSGMQSIGVSNKPTTPTGMAIINYDITPAGIGSGMPAPYNLKLWWLLDVTYGVPNCGGQPE